MYSVTDPAGEYVYLALDTGWWGTWDGNDYSQFIGEANCALYKVNISDSSYSCLHEGVLLQDMDQSYMQSVSGNQKPIQFDEDGNVFYAATPFEQMCDDYDGDGVSDYCYINFSSWIPQIYRTDSAGTRTTISQDNTFIEFFSVLHSGEVVFQGYNQTDFTAALWMWQNGSVINLTQDGGWGVNFFTADDGNTAIWGDWDSGVQFARPDETGQGVYLATLNTALFNSTGNSSYNPSPVRVITNSENGSLYGVFEDWQSTYNPDTDTWDYSTILSVYSMLPFDPIPKAKMTLDENGWWAWMEETPFQIANGYLYYKETKTAYSGGGANLGNYDVIHMLNLDDRSEILLLTDYTSAKYDMYNWRLSGNILYFSALNTSTNIVVTGKIDTSLVAAGEPESAYLTIQESASAVGAASAIKDIEVLVPTTVINDDGLAPTVTEYHINTENLYSLGMSFSEPMDRTTVESGLSLSSNELLTFNFPGGNTVQTNDVPLMKVWLGNTLHLIPDRSALALGDTTTTGLKKGTDYTLALAGTVTDSFGNALYSGAGDTELFTTLPDMGWYYSAFSNDASGTFSMTLIHIYEPTRL
ncbi:MAG: hypothetical protein HUJ29_11780, partial [Gammaproteobacteria bacterium]|nr:hypothetical protein [Gammaproteobacteria bacterium]